MNVELLSAHIKYCRRIFNAFSKTSHDRTERARAGEGLPHLNTLAPTLPNVPQELVAVVTRGLLESSPASFTSHSARYSYHFEPCSSPPPQSATYMQTICVSYQRRHVQLVASGYHDAGSRHLSGFIVALDTQRLDQQYKRSAGS